MGAGRPRLDDKIVISALVLSCSFFDFPEMKRLRRLVGRDGEYVFMRMLVLSAPKLGTLAYTNNTPYTPETFAADADMDIKSDLDTIRRTWEALEGMDVIVTDAEGIIRFVEVGRWFGKFIEKQQKLIDKRVFMRNYRAPAEKKQGYVAKAYKVVGIAAAKLDEATLEMQQQTWRMEQMANGRSKEELDEFGEDIAF
jgi:hypothetical protein